MNEKQTRTEIINSRLKEAGWDVNDMTQVVEEYGHLSPQDTYHRLIISSSSSSAMLSLYAASSACSFFTDSFRKM